jgi:Iron-binding zinc finger CDGSH type/Divergent 4Fe-4S mono-cluster
VFDEGRRPWVKVDAASAGEVEAAVALCPSGALRTRRIGVSAEKRLQPPEVRSSENGPLLVSGGVRIVDADSNLLHEGEKATLCRCGGSSNKPFCDGTHKTNGFRG